MMDPAYVDAELRPLTDEQLVSVQKELWDRNQRIADPGLVVVLVELFFFALLFVGVVNVLMGGLMYGDSWLMIPGAIGPWLSYRRRSAVKANADYMARIGREISRRSQVQSQMVKP